MDSQADNATEIEVTDVESASQEIERRFNAQDTSEEETLEAEEAEEVGQEEVEEEPEELNEEPEEQESFDSVEEIAEALDMPIDDFLSTIKVKRKINGELEEVPLSEALAGNQRDVDYRHKTMELAEQRKAFEQERDARIEAYNKQMAEVSQMATLMENQMLAQYDAINWNELEQTDPQQWLLTKTKFQEDYGKVQQIKENVSQQLQQQQYQAQQQQQAQQAQFLAKENELLLSEIPDWRDSNTRLEQTQQISNFLSNYGYSESEVAQVTDHRLVRLLRDAMLMSQNKSAGDIAKKKVKDLPKIVKPNAKLSKGRKNVKARREKLANYKKSQSNDDLAQLLLDRM